MKQSLFILTILLLCGSLFSQETIENKSRITLDISIAIKDSSLMKSKDGHLTNGFVNIYIGDEKIRSLKVNQHAQVFFKLYIQNQYKIQVGAEGYKSKIMFVDTRMSQKEEQEGYGWEFPIGAFPLVKRVDDKPYEPFKFRVFYNAKIGGYFDYDKDFEYKNEKILMSDETLTVVENAPQFPGGSDAFTTYMTNNMKYPSHIKNTDGKTKAALQFLVGTDGSISNIKFVKKSGYEDYDAAALKVVEAMPNWVPGKRDGVVDTMTYVMIVSYEVNTQTSSSQYSNFRKETGPGLRAEKNYNKALKYFDKGDYKKAVTYFSEAIKWYEDYEIAYYKRAKSYSKLAENEKACKDYRKAAELGSILAPKEAESVCD